MYLPAVRKTAAEIVLHLIDQNLSQLLTICELISFHPNTQNRKINKDQD